jgi:hypothetical protein
MTTLDLAHTIAEHLGTGWRAYPGKAADGSQAHLAGPNDQVLNLFSYTDADRKADQGRLIITGHLDFLRNHVPQGIKRDHKITVDERTPPDKIAYEIRRRLLPNYQAEPTAAWDDKHASDGTAAAGEQLAATVAAGISACSAETRPPTSTSARSTQASTYASACDLAPPTPCSPCTSHTTT